MADRTPESDRIPIRSRAVLAAAGASGTWDWDITEDQLYFDERFAELYGLAPADGQTGCPTNTFFLAIHPEDRARIKIAVAGILSGAELFSKEFRIRALDGSLVWIHARGQGHLDGADQPVRFTGLFVDVTERKRTEERLRIAQTAGGVGTFEYSDGFATASVSDQFCRLLGLHPTRVLPIRTINGVVCHGEPQIIPESYRDGVSAMVALDGEFQIKRRDDQAVRWVARRGEVVRDSETSGYRFIGVIYDVTAAKAAQEQLHMLNETLELRVQEEIAERQHAEESLRQAQKMEAVGQLTGGIAHDFNNLLTVIIGNIDTVTRRLEAESDPRTRRSLEHARLGAERAAALTQRLLAFSRRQPLAPKQTDVAHLLTGMSDLLTRSIPEAIAIQIQPAADLRRIEVDQHQLENALLNLALNARDAMPNGGNITISARNVEIEKPDTENGGSPGSYVAISVSDNGSGMSAATVAKVFDPFFTTKEVGKGTGLGLSMVYGFAKQSGGHIQIDSALGVGTTVYLYLPQSDAIVRDEPDEERALDGPASGSETIMVVEDDDDVRTYTVEILRELGYRVIESDGGVAAISQLQRREEPIQLLVTDVIMPAMSGRELADTARAIQPDLKVLFTSGYTRDVIVRANRLEPGMDLLPKPFTFATLASKVRDLLDR